jgi:hypothetical protein
LTEIIYRKGHLIPLPTQNGQSPVSVVRGGAGGPCPRHSGATPSRDKAAAKTFFRKLLKGC